MIAAGVSNSAMSPQSFRWGSESRAGDGCGNTGQIADVIVHEWGHGINDATSGNGGATGEGIADLTALRDRLVASGDASGAVRLWSPEMTDHPVASMGLDAEIVEARWAPDGRRLAVAAMNGEVAMFEVRRGVLA